mgnify:CR=1 FL=1
MRKAPERGRNTSSTRKRVNHRRFKIHSLARRACNKKVNHVEPIELMRTEELTSVPNDQDDTRPPQQVVVKFVARGRQTNRIWRRQLPSQEPVWGNCRFVLDPDATDYDWFVVHDDLPPAGSERFSLRTERLPCDPQNTILFTLEPASIKVYGSDYLAQFGHVITSQEPWVMRSHTGAEFAQPCLRWFYGVSDHKLLNYDDLCAARPPKKTELISTVCSHKNQTNTLHRRRFDFTQELRSALPKLDVFGRGVRPIDDKAEAIDEYHYHVTIENHVFKHHWTEKLADAFLGYCLPFYCGAPNAADYFPSESLIPIDIHDPGQAIATIQKAIRDDEYTKRLPYIIEARRRVLDEHNIFAVIDNVVNRTAPTHQVSLRDGILRSRRALRRHDPVRTIRYLYERVRVKTAHRWRAV